MEIALALCQEPNFQKEKHNILDFRNSMSLEDTDEAANGEKFYRLGQRRGRVKRRSQKEDEEKSGKRENTFLDASTFPPAHDASALQTSLHPPYFWLVSFFLDILPPVLHINDSCSSVQ